MESENKAPSLVKLMIGRVYFLPIFFKNIICINLLIKNIKSKIEVYIMILLALCSVSKRCAFSCPIVHIC